MLILDIQVPLQLFMTLPYWHSCALHAPLGFLSTFTPHYVCSTCGVYKPILLVAAFI